MLIQITNLYKNINEVVLLAIERLQLSRGDKVGLIGPNGSGKTSLTKILVGEDNQYQGKALVTPSVAYVPQLSDEALGQSGGERVLILLKEALRQRADLLILDEPTAHLDSETKNWLLHQLRRYPGGLLVVSHDRAFLDQLVTTIWQLDNGQVTVYIGNYSTFEVAKESEEKAQWKAFQNYQSKVHQLEGDIRSQKTKAKQFKRKKKTVSQSDWKVNSKMGAYDGKQKAIAKRAKAMTKRLEQLEKVERPPKALWAKLKPVEEDEPTANTLCRLTQGQVKRKDEPLFGYPDLVIQRGNRIILTGRNKSGKTTFIKQLLSKQLPGYYAERLVFSYLSQGLPIVNNDQTPFEWVTRESSQNKVTILNHLAMFGITYQKCHQTMSHLSGGEQVRVALVKALLADSHCLILDEPTNFLDLTAMKALEECLINYTGTFIIVSHDERFTKMIGRTYWTIKDGLLIIRD